MSATLYRHRLKPMRVSSELPTIFAKKLSIMSGLLPEQKNGVDHAELSEKNELLKYFQQMAVTSTFEDCVAVYYGIKLTDEQLSVLKLIYRTTKPWMTGHIVGVCLDRIESTRDNRDFAESVRVLVEQLGEGSGTGDLSKKMNGIMVSSSRTEKANKKSNRSKK